MRLFDSLLPNARLKPMYNVGMVVYVEYVIADNFVMTYNIALLSYRLSGMRPNKLRAAVAALTGTGAAFGYVFVGEVWAIWLLRLGLAAVLSAVLFASRNILKGALWFIASTAVFGGAVFAAGYLLTGSAEEATLCPFDIPVALPVAAGAGIYAAARRAAVSLRRRRSADVVRITVEWRGKRVSCDGLIDTGNGVFDDRTGLPVIIFTAAPTVKLLSDEEFAAFITGGKAPPGRRMEISGAGGRQKILLVQNARISLYTGENENIINDVAAGLSLIRSPYGAILGAAAVKATELRL